VAEPLTGHPAADRSTAEALVVEQSRAVVPLSGWLLDAARTAVASERLLQILTPSDAALTYPLELLLADGPGQWIVRDGPGFRDGFTAVPMGWTGARFAPVDGPVPPVPPVDIADGGLELQVTTLHRAQEELELGTAAEAVARALTGGAPVGWGVDEPVTQPWSRRELTAVCRDRAPEPTALTVVGAGVLGRLHVSRVDTGVLEELRLSGPVARDVAQAALDDLAAALAALAPPPRSMVVTVHPVRVGGLRPSRPSPPALPYALFVGPAEVARHGAEHAGRAPAGAVRLVGGAAWCRFAGAAPYEQLASTLEHFA
jgi:hypothetical protein